MFAVLGQDALLGIASHVAFMAITWRILMGVNVDALIKKGKVFEARMLIIFLTIVIGTSVSNAFLQLVSWTKQLHYLF
ncbi:DUF1146 family protein [Terribacillus sp. 179-K 1B1 HS]|uniref:DUF1146 family protein n=1 Tax=Terribacillus sp. 179-K 1B1 HS TaxID=3142388 RepID=UPI0039A128DE